MKNRLLIIFALLFGISNSHSMNLNSGPENSTCASQCNISMGSENISCPIEFKEKVIDSIAELPLRNDIKLQNKVTMFLYTLLTATFFVAETLGCIMLEDRHSPLCASANILLGTNTWRGLCLANLGVASLLFYAASFGSSLFMRCFY